MRQPQSAPLEEPSSVKAVIRDRWNIPERVEGWIHSDLNAEYRDEASRAAWKWALQEAAAGAPSIDALDIGTGPGTIAQLWAELGYATTGLDISPAMIEAGRRIAREKGLAIRFLEGDAEAPPFARKRFGVISSRFVLYTLPQPGYALRRWVGLLRPGGALVLIGHDHAEGHLPRQRRPRERPHWVDKKHQGVVCQLPFMNHKSSDLCVMMQAAGLREIRSIDLRRLLAPRGELRRRVKENAPRATPFVLVGRK